jgi:hypothetical protein
LPAVRFCCERSTDVGRPLLGRRFNGSLWLGRQLQNRSLLTLTEDRQQHDLAVRKFLNTLLRQPSGPIGKDATSPAKDSSVPGKTQTATLASSDAANPRVPVPKLRVVSLSPTFAGRDFTF